MHKNESNFSFFPSHMGFGYHGDNKRIGTNQPLICTVTLRDLCRKVYKKQMDPTSITDVPAIKKAILDPKTQVQNPTKTQDQSQYKQKTL
jgi:hypothetical protein